MDAMRSPVRRALHLAIALGLTSLASASDAHAGVLETVRARDHLLCGVGDGPKGYSTVNGAGAWSGISIDFCRALAAAVLGDKDAVKFRSLPKRERFSALQAGVPLREFVDGWHDRHARSMQRFSIGLDVYTGTSRPE